jgi:hypothetical protein
MKLDRKTAIMPIKQSGEDLAGPRRKYVPGLPSEPSLRVGNALVQKLVRKNLGFAMD